MATLYYIPKTALQKAIMRYEAETGDRIELSMAYADRFIAWAKEHEPALLKNIAAMNHCSLEDEDTTTT